MTNDAAKGIKNGNMIMPAAVMRSIFEPTASAICTLLLRQIRISGGVKNVFMVGDFGENDYLRDIVRISLDNVDPNIGLMQPQHRKTAVAREALLNALASRMPDKCWIKISSRMARRSYGISTSC